MASCCFVVWVYLGPRAQSHELNKSKYFTPPTKISCHTVSLIGSSVSCASLHFRNQTTDLLDDEVIQFFQGEIHRETASKNQSILMPGTAVVAERDGRTYLLCRATVLVFFNVCVYVKSTGKHTHKQTTHNRGKNTCCNNSSPDYKLDCTVQRV